MVNHPNISALMFVKDDPVVELLMEEYAILQDKMDKIGGFRFMIKGWALTLITGTLVAASAISLDPWTAIFLVFVLLIALWSLEYRQLKLSDTFQDRALRIENTIGRRLENYGLRRIDFAKLRQIPGIANELRKPFEHRSANKVIKSSLSDRGARLAKVMGSPWILAVRRSSLRRRVNRSDLLFYLLLLAVSIIFICFQRGKILPDRHNGIAGHFLRTSISPTIQDAYSRGFR